MNTDHFKKKLEDELKTLTKELDELGWKNPETGEWEAATTDLDSSATEEDELADNQEEYGEHQAEIEPLELRYIEVKHALEKIDENIFGTCEVCDIAIEEDRLEANPAARTCKEHLNSTTV
jgi:RNA polymerase-binding transcription factor DksA